MKTTKVLYRRGDLSHLGVYLSNTTLLRMEAAGKFPQRVYLSPHAVAWVAEEINEHIAALASAREVA